MSQYNNQSKFATNGQQTLWLKHKFVKKKNGEMKEVFQGSVDNGAGKMIKIQIDARLYVVQKENKKGEMESLLPAYVSKWMSTRQNNTQQQQSRKAW